MSSDYEKFTEYMKKQDAKLPNKDMKVSVGMKDEKGNLLILGGHKVNLWRLASGMYAVGGEITSSDTGAIKAYNSYNGTDLQEDYIWDVFEPWYKKQFTIVASVPSSRDPDVTYTVRRSPDGELICDPKCLGFRHYGYCWHIEAVKELISA